MLSPMSSESLTDTVRREQLLKSLRDPEYRREFAADIGTGIAFQIRLLREDRGWTQDELAHQTGKRQETISQWENPNYGKYTLSTLKNLAGAFDVALIVRFAPFSELIDWAVNLSSERLAPPSFDAEFAATRETPPLKEDSNADQLPAAEGFVSSAVPAADSFNSYTYATARPAGVKEATYAEAA